MPLTIGTRYSRKDIFRIFSVPSDIQRQGDWFTGYNQYNNDLFIFASVKVKGRTGHDYNNKFKGTELIWYGRNKRKLSHPSSQSLINPEIKKYIFARENSDPNFYYLGIGRAKEVISPDPINILWAFDDPTEFHPEILPEEIVSPDALIEGAKMKITINTYERNPIARQRCLDHFGYSCSVCTFDFYEKYGDIGKKFAHVHHLKLLREVGVEYEINPIEDLRPVCPNCHAMLHKRDPIYSIEELQQLLRIRSIQPATWD